MLKAYLLPSESPGGIYRDFIEGLPQAERFLGAHYGRPGVFARRADDVCAAYRGARVQLAEMLLDYNRHVGCSAETEKQIEKLRDTRAVAVLCGQQAGLLTGPLYTVYKAIAAVKLAKKLEAELERPVVPVFWVAAEDHDLSEANHCYVFDRENRPKRIQLALEHEGEPVGRLRLDDEDGAAVLAEFGTTAAQTEFLPDLLAWLDEARRLSPTAAEWFARIMTRLFAREGLVLFDPLLPAARRMALPLFLEALEKREEAAAAIKEREIELVKAGYALQVEREADATLLMVMKERRTALYFRNGGYETRDGSVRFSGGELAALVRAAPDTVSPNVLLRPVMQDRLFPTAVFIPGPGETAYFAQVLALYPVFGVVPPVLSPRPGLTVVEPRLVRHIKKYDIPEGALLTELDRVLEHVLRRSNDVDLDRVFCHLRRHLSVEYDHLKEELVRLNPQLGVLAEKNLQHVYSEIRYLEGKARDEFKLKNEGTMRHFTAIKEALQPFGKPQERVYTVLTFLAKYGPDWWSRLVDQFPTDPGHYLLGSG